MEAKVFKATLLLQCVPPYLIIFYCFTKYLLLHGVIAKNLKILQSSLHILRLYAVGKPHSQLYLLQKVYLILDCLVISALETHPRSQIC